MSEIVIHNGPNLGEPLLTLQRQDGSLLDVYRLSDLPAALTEAIGPVPPAPAFVQIVRATNGVLDHGDYFSGALTFPTVSVSGDPAFQGLVDAYRAQIDAYNVRAQTLADVVKALLATLGTPRAP